MKRPYFILILILAATAIYFMLSTEKETKPGLSADDKSKTDLRQSGEPVNVSDSSSSFHARDSASDKANSAKIQPNPAINPVHGQPGHRCDIKVGDPIPAGASVTSQTSITPQASVSPQNSPVVTTPGSTSAKLNPAHGQPGHRCDIQVGSPLPSS